MSDTDKNEKVTRNDWHDFKWLTGWNPTWGVDHAIIHLTTPLRSIHQDSKVLVAPDGDLFGPDVEFETIAAVFAVMAVCENHTYLVATEHVDRMALFFQWVAVEAWPRVEAGGIDEIEANAVLQFAPGSHSDGYCPTCSPDDPDDGCCKFIGDHFPAPWPLPNVWLAAKVPHQAAAQRIRTLCKIPAVIHASISDPLNDEVFLNSIRTSPDQPLYRYPGVTWSARWNALKRPRKRKPGETVLVPAAPTLDWVICGGAYGLNAIAVHPHAVRQLRDQCDQNNVPFWFTGYSDGVSEPKIDGVTYADAPEAIK